MIKIEDGHDLATRNSGTLRKPQGSLTVGKLELELVGRYPRADAEPWDRMGLLAGDPAALVTGVAVALDPTPDAVHAAKSAGANVLLTHHPAFIDPPCVFSPSREIADLSGAVVYAAISENVALINIHTALDASAQATSLYPRLLSLKPQKLLAPLAHDPKKGYAISCSVRAEERPFTLAHLAARATAVFGCTPRVWGDFNSEVVHIVVANGSASDFVDDACHAGADCLVCGEVRYHAALAANQAGLAIVELGHDVSEFPLCAVLAQAAIDAGVPRDRVVVLDQSANWRYPDPMRA